MFGPCFFYSVLCPSSAAITCMGNESWLLYFNCVPEVLWLLVLVSLFLTEPYVGLQCVIVVIPIYTYLLFKMIPNTI